MESLGSGLSGEEKRAQEYVCTLTLRIKRFEERANDKEYVQKTICAHCCYHQMILGEHCLLVFGFTSLKND